MYTLKPRQFAGWYSPTKKLLSHWWQPEKKDPHVARSWSGSSVASRCGRGHCDPVGCLCWKCVQMPLVASTHQSSRRAQESAMTCCFGGRMAKVSTKAPAYFFRSLPKKRSKLPVNRWINCRLFGQNFSNWTGVSGPDGSGACFSISIERGLLYWM